MVRLGPTEGVPNPRQPRPPYSKGIPDQVPEGTRYAPWRPRRRVYGQGAARGSGPGFDRGPEARTAARKVLQGRGRSQRLRVRDSGRELSPGLYHHRLQYREDRSIADLPESAQEHGLHRDDHRRAAARRRPTDELRSVRDQRNVQEAVRREVARGAPTDADRRDKGTGLIRESGNLNWTNQALLQPMQQGFSYIV